MSTGPEIARAILRHRFGPRAKPAPQTADVACPWCGAAAGRPCRLPAPMDVFPLAEIHDARWRLLQPPGEETP